MSWWVVDSLVGSDVEAELDELVPYWVAQDWPFEKPRYVPREMTWAQWLALPETPRPVEGTRAPVRARRRAAPVPRFSLAWDKWGSGDAWDRRA